MYAIKTLSGFEDCVWVKVDSDEYVVESDRTVFKIYEEALFELRYGMWEVIVEIDKESTGE